MAQKLLHFQVMSDNRIGWNYSSLNTSNNGLIERERERENSVIQTEQNFTVDKKSQQTSLTTAFNNLDRIVREKLKPCFKNSWKNFWNRGRERALKDTKKALDSLGNENSLGDENKKPDFGKAEQNKVLFKNALHNESLSKETRKALEALIEALRTGKGCLKTVYSKTQLKEIFHRIQQIESNRLGQGGYGTVYKGGENLVFKVINKKKAFECDVNGNKAFLKGANNFTDNKELFYRQSNGLVTEYIDSFKENGQYVAVFERITGDDLGTMLKAEDLTYASLKMNLMGYQEQYDTAVKQNKQGVEKFKKKLENAKKEKKTIDLERCIILSQTAEGIAAVHESGCIHRDIKPQNTMVETEKPARDQSGNVIKNEKGEIQMEKVEFPGVKLIDQGLAIDMKNGEGLQNLPSAGTPRFMAPEIIFNHNASPACDVFSFGITLLTATCNTQTPFLETYNPIKNAIKSGNNSELKNAQKTHFKNLKTTIEKCYTITTTTGEKKPFLRDLVLKCCSLKPEDRPSAAQVAYCLQVYRAAVDVEQEKELNFDNVLKMAEADRPKGIPLALRDMMQSGDEAVRQRGCRAVLNLGDADPSYKKTPSYGLALLRSGKKDEFKSWASQWEADLQGIKNTHPGFENLKDERERLKKQIAASRKEIEVLSKINTEIGKGDIEVKRTFIQKQLDAIDALNALEARLNQNPLFNLMQRITTDNLSNNGNAVWGTKDIKVSQDEFSIINNLFPKESINPKNIV